MTKSEQVQRTAIKNAARQGLSLREYKRRCDINTAKKKGLSPAEYSKKRVADAAQKKNMSVAEYKNTCYENTARNHGFRCYKDYDKASKKAKKLGVSLRQYQLTLPKDKEGFYSIDTSGRKQPSL